MKFIADAMLGKLAKRMRLFGFDVLYDPAFDDNAIIRLALEQNRVILTRDTGLASRPLAQNPILIKNDLVDEQLKQVLDAFTMPDNDAFTRCSVCNEQLSELNKQEARNLVPDHIISTVNVFWRCGKCGRVYWKGSHVRNMTGRPAKQ
jgi:uncharacterized protein with PIN domain